MRYTKKSKRWHRIERMQCKNCGRKVRVKMYRGKNVNCVACNCEMVKAEWKPTPPPVRDN